MISIKLVRIGGVLIGQTASDRWNMLQLGIDYTITADRNQTAVKRLRREWGDCLTFSVVRNESVVWKPTSAECAALGSQIAKIAA